MTTPPYFNDPAWVLYDQDEHPVVVRHVLSRWHAEMNTADIARAAGMLEADCARIIRAYQDRRHEWSNHQKRRAVA